MSQVTSLTKETWLIITAIAIAAVIVIGINKANMRELRTEVRAEIHEIRGLLIAHISGSSHAKIVADSASEEVAQ